jgi:pilus assembly protein CpaC
MIASWALMKLVALGLAILCDLHAAFVFLPAALIGLPAASAAEHPETSIQVFLEVGERKVLEVVGHQKIFVPQTDILRLRDLGSRLELRGLRPGTVSARIGSTIYEIFVVAASGEMALNEQIRRLQGLKFKHHSGRLQVLGELWRFSDWLRLAQILGNTAYAFQARMDDEVEQEAMDYFYTELRRRNLPLPSSPLNFPQAVHFGHVSPSDATTLQKFLARFGLESVVDDQGLSLVPLVRLKVLVAEVSREFTRQLGIQWQSSYQAQILPQIADPNGLMVQIQSLETKGQGQILASPNLVCRSGGEAEFMAGGEFPIRLQSFQQNHVTWKRHGVMLHFQPQADAVGHISMNVGVEVSVIDPHQIVDGVPGLKTNRIQSQLNLMSNKTVVLSGLLRNNFGRHQEGLVFLQDLPILGSLFNSKNFLENRTEMVVFVTPSIETLEGPSVSTEVPHGWRPFEYLKDE